MAKTISITKSKKDGPNKNRYPIFPLRFLPDDLTALHTVEGRYTLKNIAVTVRLCVRILVQLRLSIEEVARLNAQYEATHKDCIHISIGESGGD